MHGKCIDSLGFQHPWEVRSFLRHVVDTPWENNTLQHVIYSLGKLIVLAIILFLKVHLLRITVLWNRSHQVTKNVMPCAFRRKHWKVNLDADCKRLNWTLGLLSVDKKHFTSAMIYDFRKFANRLKVSNPNFQAWIGLEMVQWVRNSNRLSLPSVYFSTRNNMFSTLNNKQRFCNTKIWSICTVFQKKMLMVDMIFTTFLRMKL